MFHFSSVRTCEQHLHLPSTCVEPDCFISWCCVCAFPYLTDSVVTSYTLLYWLIYELIGFDVQNHLEQYQGPKAAKKKPQTWINFKPYGSFVCQTKLALFGSAALMSGQSSLWSPQSTVCERIKSSTAFHVEKDVIINPFWFTRS